MRLAAAGLAACCAVHLGLTAAIGGSVVGGAGFAIALVPVTVAAYAVQRRADRRGADADRC